MTFPAFLDALDCSSWPEEVRDRLVGNALALTAALDALDLKASIGSDLHRIASHQRKHSDHMEVLSPPFDPKRHGACDFSSSIIVVIENQHGEEVGIEGARLFWSEDSLAECIRSVILPGSNVTAPSAERLVSSCPIAWSGAAHVVKGQPEPVFKIMARLLHLAVLIRWKWSWRVGIAKESVARVAGNKIYGFPTIEQGVWREGMEPSFLMLSARQIDRERIPQSAYADIARPLGVMA